MNLIEISNQLKDVPDQFLMKEVQVPSGAYPSYLVISELTRRKRMRENATKEAPQTTVAQDLADPGREQRQMAMAQAAQQMAAPQAPSLNAGLAAAPQAMESLAAQDAMGTTPPEMMMPAQGMAAGGMVSFKQGGDVVRAYDGLPESNFSDSGRGLSSVIDLDPSREKFSPARKIGAFFKPDVMFYEYMNPEDKINFEKTGVVPDYAKQRYFATESKIPSTSAAKFADMKDKEDASTLGTVRTAAPSATAGSSSNPLVTYRDPYAQRMAGILERFDKSKPPSEQDLETAALTRQARYEEDVPFRLGYLEKEMAGRSKELADRKQSNINEALIQAGLGIMGSKSPRFLQAASEGGTAGLRAYQQGVKDIRAGEDLLRQSKIDYNKAQMLYDQGKFNEGDKARQQSVEEYKRGIDYMNTESAILNRASESSRAAFKLPYEIQYMQQAGAGRGRVDTTPSPAEVKTAQELGNKALLTEIQRPGTKIKLGTPEAEAFVNNYARDILAQSGKVYVPPSIAPTQTVRGSPESAAR
jgi:hypothetical protein